MKRFIFLGAAVLVVVLVWSGGWFVASGIVSGEVRKLAKADGIAAPRLECTGLDVAGFPFRFDVTCTGSVLTSGDMSVSVPELKATVLVYRPTHAQIFAQGPADITDAFTGRMRQLRWNSPRASIRLAGWRLARTSVVGEDFELLDTLIGETTVATASGFQFHLLDMDERYDPEAGLQSLALYQELEGVDVPDSGITGGRWTTEAEISELPADVRRWTGRDLLQRWQQAGGNFALVSLDASDEDRSLQATGDLSLGETGRLNGQLDITSNGVVEEFRDDVPEPYRSILFSTPAEDGSYSQTVFFQSGLIMAGLAPVGMIPPLF